MISSNQRGAMKINLRFIIGGLVALLIGIFIGFLITDQKLLFKVVFSNYDLLLQMFTVAVGGLIGAYSAFWLKSYNDDKKQREKEVTALNSEIFVSVRQLNAIRGIKKELEKYKTDFERSIILPSLSMSDFSDLKHKIEKIEFLYKKEEPQILYELVIVQQMFDIALNLIEDRNRFHFDEVRSVILKLHGAKKEIKYSEVEEILGSTLYREAISRSRKMYNHMEKLEEKLDDNYKKLREIAKKNYPGEGFISWIQE
jgi:hypothetical protein